MGVRDLLRENLAQRQGELIRLCQELIRVPSEDPPGDNRPIAAFVQAYLGKHGVSTELCGPDPLRPNVIGRVAFARRGPNVVLNGHLETLPVGDRTRWTYDPFAATIADGRLYGRGASCMKGGIAGLITTALALREHAAHLTGSVTLTLVSDEVNGGGVGTGWVVDHVPEAQGDAALVAEGGAAILVGHKGPVFLELKAKGSGGHGAYGFNRVSATHRMIAVLDELRRLEGPRIPPPPGLGALIEAGRADQDAQLGAGATDALMTVSVNVGSIQGGDKVNVIAEHCTAHVDCRVPVGMTIADLMARVDEIIGRHQGVSARTLWANEPTAAALDHRWIRLLRENSRAILGQPLPLRVGHGFTDARFFHLKKIPAAGIGRRGANVGAPDEYIEVDSLRDSTSLYAVSIFDYLTGASADA